MVASGLLPAGAVWTAHGTVDATSTQLVATKDTGNHRAIVGIYGSRIPAMNPMWLAIGSNNQATTLDVEIMPGNHFMLNSLPNYPVVRGGDVAAIAAHGGATSFVLCARGA